MSNLTSFDSVMLYMKTTNKYKSFHSEGIEQAITFADFNEVPYYQGQFTFFDPSILHDVARTTNLSVRDVGQLNYSLEGPIVKVKTLLDDIQNLCPVQRLNLSYCLATIARIHLSEQVFNQIDLHLLTPREKVTYYTLETILISRKHFTPNLESTFQQLKKLLKENTFPDRLILLTVAFSAVWYSRKAIGEKLCNWFVDLGSETLKHVDRTDFFNQIALSSYYRSISMIPAKNHDEIQTRKMMALSGEFFESSLPKNRYEKCIRNLTGKAYYESELKEYMQFKQIEKAIESGKRLLNFDPNWSISYQHVAEVYIAQKDYKSAMECICKAEEIGTPRSLFTACYKAYLHEELQQFDKALHTYNHILEMDKTNVAAAISGYNLAKQQSSSQLSHFTNELKRLELENLFLPEHLELLL